MKTENHYMCPVCGKHDFVCVDSSFDECPVCGWIHDRVQELYPDEDYCGNDMSLNHAREAWKKGEKIH